MATLVECTKASYHNQNQSVSTVTQQQSIQTNSNSNLNASSYSSSICSCSNSSNCNPNNNCNNGSFAATTTKQIIKEQQQRPQSPILSNNDKSTSFIELDDFVQFLTTLPLIILDCRVLKDYQLRHIKNSVHLNCRDKITKKRLSTKKLTVKDIVNCEETKRKLEAKINDAAKLSSSPFQGSNDDKMIIIYDDHTNDYNELLLEWNPLKIVMDNLRQCCNIKICKILRGGFNMFSERCPELCEINDNKCELKPKIYYNLCEESLQRDAIDNTKMTQILSHLYLGNECDSKNEEVLLNEGIHYILNVTKNIPCYFETNPKFKYKRIAVNDSCNENLKQYFDEAEKFIDDAKLNNSKVLVHCQAGISRSPTIVIAYLMKNLNLKMNDAYNIVRDKRSIIGPNFIFIGQLSDYEDKLEMNKKPNIKEELANSCHTIATRTMPALLTSLCRK